jgi:hypothetical protein
VIRGFDPSNTGRSRGGKGRASEAERFQAAPGQSWQAEAPEERAAAWFRAAVLALAFGEGAPPQADVDAWSEIWEGSG